MLSTISFLRALGITLFLAGSACAANMIFNVYPATAPVDTTDLLVTIDLDPAPATPPPAEPELPIRISIGDINGTNINRDGSIVSAVFDIPLGTIEEVKTVEVEYSGAVLYSDEEGFEVGPAISGGQTGLIIKEPGFYPGYTLFCPLDRAITYLIDMSGSVVHEWRYTHSAGLSLYLMEDGSLLKATRFPNNSPTDGGGDGGAIEHLAPNGDQLWFYEFHSETYEQHHDIEPLPNGNVLLIAWEVKTEQEVLDAGRDPALLENDQLWPDMIIEVKPEGLNGGEIVWEWHVWDHLVQQYDDTKENYGIVADHPELADINWVTADEPDWIHTNSVDYNPALDQIAISARNFNEVWIIDHSTTTEEAAGHTGGMYGRGGDILYRWGNPQAYGAGDADDRWYYEVHDVRWVEPGLPGEGNITCFDNGYGRPLMAYSSVIEFTPPLEQSGLYTYTPGEAFGPEDPVFVYTSDPKTDFYSHRISGAERLPNGNTIICEGVGSRIFEITPNEDIVWQYVNPYTSMGWTFRASRYSPDYPGIRALNLPATGTWSLY